MATEVPCLTCTHAVSKHHSGFCFGCFEDDRLDISFNKRHLPGSSLLSGISYLGRVKHEFVGDNLKYLEDKAIENDIKRYKQ